MDMFQERMNNYKDSVQPVEYYRQYIRSENVATSGDCDQLMLFKHGFFIRNQFEQGTVVEFCSTITSFPSAMMNGNYIGKLGLKVLINNEEVMSIKTIPSDYDFFEPQSLKLLEVAADLLDLGYLKPGYSKDVVTDLFTKCTLEMGMGISTLAVGWKHIPFDDGDVKKTIDGETYWCLRKHSGKNYVTKYCKSNYADCTEAGGSKVVISEPQAEASPVTLQEVLNALS